MTAIAVTPTAGLLADGGFTVLHARVRHRPVPQSAPKHLTGVVEPVHDESGAVTDWRLSADANAEQRVAFAQWHSTFLLERILGGVAMVRSFLRWADHHLDVSAIHVLTLDSCRLEPNALARAEHQARKAHDVLRARNELGIGITSPQRHGLVRGFAVDDAPVLLFEGGGASISAVKDGIQVTSGGRTFVVTEWRQQDGTVTARTADGEAVDLGSSAAAQLLCRLAPGCDDATVTQMPLATIFAPLLVFLPELAHAAGTDRVPVEITAL